MKAVKFEQANIMLAENQPEYETLPVHVDVDADKQIVMLADGTPRDPLGEMTFCMQLSKAEIADILQSDGKVWLTQCTHWNAFQPIRMSTQNPFKEKENLVDNYKASQGQ